MELRDWSSDVCSSDLSPIRCSRHALCMTSRGGGKTANRRAFRVFTDLPLRQIYHFGPARQCKLSASSDRRSACMIMLFVDARYVHYWKGLEEMDNARSDFEELINERSRREVVGGYRAGNAVVTRVQELLSKVAGRMCRDQKCSYKRIGAIGRIAPAGTLGRWVLGHGRCRRNLCARFSMPTSLSVARHFQANRDGLKER